MVWGSPGGSEQFVGGDGRRYGGKIWGDRENACMQFGLVRRKHKQDLRSKLFIDGTRVGVCHLKALQLSCHTPHSTQTSFGFTDLCRDLVWAGGWGSSRGTDCWENWVHGGESVLSSTALLSALGCGWVWDRSLKILSGGWCRPTPNNPY